jgi:hypothetical protein
MTIVGDAVVQVPREEEIGAFDVDVRGPAAVETHERTVR